MQNRNICIVELNLEMNHETVRVDMRGIEGRGLYLGKVSSEEVD